MVKSWFDDATARVACSRCSQPAGSYCRMPSGRLAKEPHIERLAALGALPDFNQDDYTVKAMTFADVLGWLGVTPAN